MKYWFLTKRNALFVNGFQNHVRGFIYVSHDGNDELRVLLQYGNPAVQIGGVIVENTLVEAQGIARVGSRQFSHQLLLGILRITEPVTLDTVQAALRTRRVRHLMQGRRIVLHTVLVNLVLVLADVELLLLRHDDDVTGRAVVRIGRYLIILDGANPLLFLKETVKRLVLVHALGITHLRSLELLNHLVIFLLVDLGEVRLIHVEDVVGLHEGKDRTPVLLLAGHIPVVITVNTLAVGVLDGHIPVDDRHRLGTLVDTGVLLLDLEERHIHGSLVAVHGRVHLQKEGVRA